MSSPAKPPRATHEKPGTPPKATKGGSLHAAAPPGKANPKHKSRINKVYPFLWNGMSDSPCYFAVDYTIANPPVTSVHIEFTIHVGCKVFPDTICKFTPYRYPGSTSPNHLLLVVRCDRIPSAIGDPHSGSIRITVMERAGDGAVSKAIPIFFGAAV